MREDRSSLGCEAPLTMWLAGALSFVELLARVLPRLRKEPPSEASNVWTPTSKDRAGCRYRNGCIDEAAIASTRQVNQHSNPSGLPRCRRGEEPSKAYRWNLQQHEDATYVNLGTTYGSPLGE
jgi:hypothetical protein